MRMENFYDFLQPFNMGFSLLEKNLLTGEQTLFFKS